MNARQVRIGLWLIGILAFSAGTWCLFGWQGTAIGIGAYLIIWVPIIARLDDATTKGTQP